MLTLYPHDTLGKADHGWLKARHHFSFGTYHNPNRRHFGALRVINDDRVAAGAGFQPHPHRDMEIITYVRSGAITHEDNMGNRGRTEAGDVQVMSAGTGVVHSEFNLEPTDTTLFQIWIEPRERAVAPRWEARGFPKELQTTHLPLLVSGNPADEAEGALFIHQDATIHGGQISAGSTISHPVRHQAYLLVAKGSVQVQGQAMRTGDGAEVVDLPSVTIHALEDSELLVIDVPGA